MNIKWTKAPTKMLWGGTMVVADIEIDADHTLSLYCEIDQAAKVSAMLNESNDLRAALQERDAEIERLRVAAKYAEHIDATPENQFETMLHDLITERDAQRKVLEQALEALNSVAGKGKKCEAAITAIQGVLK